MKNNSVFIAIAWALLVLCVLPAAAQSPGLTMNLVVTPDPVWPGGPFTVNGAYTLDTPAPVTQSEAVITIRSSGQVTGLPAGCTADTTYNYGEQTTVTCSLGGLQQGTHPLFDTAGITGTMDSIGPSPISTDGSLEADYAGGSVNATASQYTGVRNSVPGDYMVIQLVSLTANVVPGGTIIYDVLYSIQASLLIDHSDAFFTLDPAINITSVGWDCMGNGDSAICGFGLGGMKGTGTGLLSAIYGGVIEGVVSPSVQPGYQLTSTVGWDGAYDGGWGYLGASNTSTITVGKPVPVPEFPGPLPEAAGLAALAGVVFLAKRRR